MAVATAVAQASWSALAAYAVAGGALFLAWKLLPHFAGPGALPAIPRVELHLRLAAALALAAFILWSAPIFGPVVSGILLSLPITGSIMPPFTLALYGPDALARLLRGFVVGLAGFTTFFFVLAAALASLGLVAAFGAAAAGALAAVFLVGHASREGRESSPPEELP